MAELYEAVIKNDDFFWKIIRLWRPEVPLRAFILNAQKVNVTVKRNEKHGKEYYNQILYEYIKFKERFVLKLFPEYNEAINAVS